MAIRPPPSPVWPPDRAQGRGGRGGGPDPPLRIEGVPQGQGPQAATQGGPDGLQERHGLGLGKGPQGRGGLVRDALLGPAHDRLPVGADDQAQGPAGVHLAVVALARAIDQCAAGPGSALELQTQGPRIAKLGGAIGGHTPLGPFREVRHVGGFAAQGELHPGGGQAAIDLTGGGQGPVEPGGWSSAVRWRGVGWWRSWSQGVKRPPSALCSVLQIWPDREPCRRRHRGDRGSGPGVRCWRPPG